MKLKAALGMSDKERSMGQNQNNPAASSNRSSKKSFERVKNRRSSEISSRDGGDFERDIPATIHADAIAVPSDSARRTL